MKKLYLPKAATLRFNLEAESDESVTGSANHAEDMAVIEQNGSEIISAAIMLEDRMIEGTSKILFGATTNTQSREFFAGEIMGSSDFSYAFKRRTFVSFPVSHTVCR